MTVTAFPNGISIEGGLTLTAAQVAKKASSAFAGATGNAHGDSAGTSNPYTLFTVTGVVELKIFGIVNTLLTGTGTLEVGVTGNTAALIAQSTGTDLDANEVWVDATPGLGAEALPTGSFIVSNLNIIETVGTADITAGQIDYYCIWRPISTGATVVAA